MSSTEFPAVHLEGDRSLFRTLKTQCTKKNAEKTWVEEKIHGIIYKIFGTCWYDNLYIEILTHFSTILRSMEKSPKRDLDFWIRSLLV